MCLAELITSLLLLNASYLGVSPVSVSVPRHSDDSSGKSDINWIYKHTNIDIEGKLELNNNIQ